MGLPRILCAALLAAFGAAVQAGPLAYVPNEKSATLSVIDTATDARHVAVGVVETCRPVHPDHGHPREDGEHHVDLVGGAVLDRRDLSLAGHLVFSSRILGS